MNIKKTFRKLFFGCFQNKASPQETHKNEDITQSETFKILLSSNKEKRPSLKVKIHDNALKGESYKELLKSDEHSITIQNKNEFKSYILSEINNAYYPIELDHILARYENARWKNTPAFVPNPRFGKVIKVYDGDTFTVVAEPFQKVGCGLYRFQIRIAGIDAPELRSKNIDENTVAMKAQKALADLILGSFVLLDVIKTDKYGRLLSHVYADCLNIGDWLVKERYAVPYSGKGVDHLPQNWLEYHNHI